MLSSFRQRSSVQFVARTDSYINECIKIYMCWLSAFRSTCRSIAPEANKVLPVDYCLTVYLVPRRPAITKQLCYDFWKRCSNEFLT